jgi:hypothetical protein
LSGLVEGSGGTAGGFLSSSSRASWTAVSSWASPRAERAVVDEDGSGGGLDVEVVVAGDGEVPHPAGGVLGGPAAGDSGGAAVRVRRWVGI